VVEYGLVLAVVVAVFIIMQFYLKRGIQAGLKISADQLGNQEESYSYTDPTKGAVLTANIVATTPVGSSWVKRTVAIGGERTTNTQDVKHQESTSESTRQDDGLYEVKR